jgi:hypothetical protein
MHLLRPNSAGELVHVSLLDHIPEQYRDFSNVWETVSSPDGVYFVTAGYLFRWDGSEMKA